MFAVSNGDHLKIISNLIDDDTDLKKKNDKNKTAQDIAQEKGHTNSYEFLKSEHLNKFPQYKYNPPFFKGYRLDWCYTWGKECGEVAAKKWCESQGYSQMLGFDKEGNIGRTIILSDSKKCTHERCGSFDYIECKV